VSVTVAADLPCRAEVAATFVGAAGILGVFVGVAVGGTGVNVGVGNGVFVAVGAGNGVFVAVGGTGVNVAVGGSGVAVGGTGVFVAVGIVCDTVNWIASS